MFALSRADVLKPDEPNYPTHYNRAYTTVLDAIEEMGTVQTPPPPSKQVAPGPQWTRNDNPMVFQREMRRRGKL